MTSIVFRPSHGYVCLPRLALSLTHCNSGHWHQFRVRVWSVPDVVACVHHQRPSAFYCAIVRCFLSFEDHCVSSLVRLYPPQQTHCLPLLAGQPVSYSRDLSLRRLLLFSGRLLPFFSVHLRSYGRQCVREYVVLRLVTRLLLCGRHRILLSLRYFSAEPGTP